MAPGFSTKLLQGIAAHLADRVPNLAWSATDPYPAAAVGIYVGSMPASPDRAVALTAYPVEDNPALTDDITGIQVRSRGTQDPRVATDLDDAIFEVLQGATGLTLGGVYVTQLWRNSGGPMGADANRRHEMSSNYYAHTNRPTAHRTD